MSELGNENSSMNRRPAAVDPEGTRAKIPRSASSTPTTTSATRAAAARKLRKEGSRRRSASRTRARSSSRDPARSSSGRSVASSSPNSVGGAAGGTPVRSNTSSSRVLAANDERIGSPPRGIPSKIMLQTVNSSESDDRTAVTWETRSTSGTKDSGYGGSDNRSVRSSSGTSRKSSSASSVSSSKLSKSTSATTGLKRSTSNSVDGGGGGRGVVSVGISTPPPALPRGADPPAHVATSRFATAGRRSVANGKATFTGSTPSTSSPAKSKASPGKTGAKERIKIRAGSSSKKNDTTSGGTAAKPVKRQSITTMEEEVPVASAALLTQSSLPSPVEVKKQKLTEEDAKVTFTASSDGKKIVDDIGSASLEQEKTDGTGDNTKPADNSDKAMPDDMPKHGNSKVIEEDCEDDDKDEKNSGGGYLNNFLGVWYRSTKQADPIVSDNRVDSIASLGTSRRGMGPVDLDESMNDDDNEENEGPNPVDLDSSFRGNEQDGNKIAGRVEEVKQNVSELVGEDTSDDREKITTSSAKSVPKELTAEATTKTIENSTTSSTNKENAAKADNTDSDDTVKPLIDSGRTESPALKPSVNSGNAVSSPMIKTIPPPRQKPSPVAAFTSTTTAANTTPRTVRAPSPRATSSSNKKRLRNRIEKRQLRKEKEKDQKEQELLQLRGEDPPLPFSPPLKKTQLMKELSIPISDEKLDTIGSANCPAPVDPIVPTSGGGAISGVVGVIDGIDKKGHVEGGDTEIDVDARTTTTVHSTKKNEEHFVVEEKKEDTKYKDEIAVLVAQTDHSISNANKIPAPIDGSGSGVSMKEEEEKKTAAKTEACDVKSASSSGCTDASEAVHPPMTPGREKVRSLSIDVGESNSASIVTMPSPKASDLIQHFELQTTPKKSPANGCVVPPSPRSANSKAAATGNTNVSPRELHRMGQQKSVTVLKTPPRHPPSRSGSSPQVAYDHPQRVQSPKWVNSLSQSIAKGATDGESGIEASDMDRMMLEVKKMELRMESRMLRMEQQLEKQLKTRMRALEDKMDERMDEIQAMLEVMLSKEISCKSITEI